jgi:polyhydroxyalkanoate synthesis regulator phasin
MNMSEKGSNYSESPLNMESAERLIKRVRELLEQGPLTKEEIKDLREEIIEKRQNLREIQNDHAEQIMVNPRDTNLMNVLAELSDLLKELDAK